MFPVFLALRHQHHSTSAFPESLLLPDREIIHAMNAFKSLANEALERSRTASDALKYACHNWAVHLSRAPRPWDDTLNHIFQAFWNDHIISWLEMEWCLKGLLPCLGILSEGQKLAKFDPVNAQHNQGLSAIDPDFHHSLTNREARTVTRNGTQSWMKRLNSLWTIPRNRNGTKKASAPASTSGCRPEGPSAPAAMLLTEELVDTSHVRPVPNPRPSTQPPPSTSPLTPPLLLVPPPRLDTAVLHIGTSRRHVIETTPIAAQI
ncbi:hypothetical protein DFJ58DRAFT_735065 [Suillus subalutaceus]|uniref:uncharacterized protein n=1 Tax=Suillus subalutaceus TaxID=48586 RepID=UPI001B860C5E|nr:uncharacterized protein DFJ58DRAFT_735065 [Suillus subalutaceus]KAG1836331.1 hypothetical protein DFJ58DRAFT_735065 [Suillus subalutaceus]